MLELSELGGVVVVRWSLSLSEAGVLLTHLLLVGHHVVEIEVGEDAVVGDAIIGGCGLEVVQMGETGAVMVTQVMGHVLVTIVDGVAVLAIKETENVLLHDRVLMDSASVCTTGLSADTITESEDILITVVLESVAVDINHTLSVTNSRVKQELVLFARWVDGGANVVFLVDLTRVDVLENSNLAVSLLFDAHELPAEHNIDTALCALVKSNLVSVGEGINKFVGSPVLNSGSSGGSTDKFILTDDRFVVKRVKVGTLTLVGHGG